MERWLDISGFPNHQVSDLGRVRNKRTGYILKPFPDRYGYLRLSLGNVDNVYVHKLVCETFYGRPDDERMQVNHIDADRQNNELSNLEWCTPSENIKWGVTKGNIRPEIGLSRAREANVKKVRIVETNQVFDSVRDCAEYLGVAPTNVSRCIRGTRAGQALHGCHIEYA